MTPYFGYLRIHDDVIMVINIAATFFVYYLKLWESYASFHRKEKEEKAKEKEEFRNPNYCYRHRGGWGRDSTAKRQNKEVEICGRWALSTSQVNQQ